MRRHLYSIATAVALLAGAGAAQALQLQSWDTKIDHPKRFAVLSAFNNQAVLDRETQLVWVRAPRGTPLRTFSGAFNTCYATEIGGRLGWRVPTMAELTSLLDRTQRFPPLPPGHPFDVSAFTRDVWSASSLPGTGDAFTQDMRGDGFLGSTSKSTQLNVWCVRGGTGVEGQ